MCAAILIRKVPPVSSPVEFGMSKTAGGDTGGTHFDRVVIHD
jgi:hypothetical protein